jgi:hypothetical protein
MFVVGLNSDRARAQCNEAKYCALMLSAVASQGSNSGLKENKLLLDQIEQGFKLVRIESKIHRQSSAQLSHMFGFDEAMTKQITKSIEKTTAAHAEEASISPCSRRLLHQDDLSELAELLGGGEKLNIVTDLAHSWKSIFRGRSGS